jgi:membrane fusion protein, multidrug efflux system
MRKRWWVTTFILIVLFGSIFGFKIFMYFVVKSYMKHFEMPPASVTTQKLEETVWQPTIRASGQLLAVQGVHVTAKTTGMIDQYWVKSGDEVKAGQAILELDHKALDASLLQVKAQEKLALIELSRQKELYQVGATSKDALDQAEASWEELSAQVQVIQANIDDHIVRAPFDGAIGIMPTNLGQYVNPGDDLGMISNSKEFWVEFPVTQQELSQIELGLPLEFTVDAYPGVIFKNKIRYLDNYFSSQTYSLMVRGQVDNTDLHHPLYPGMVIDVQMLLAPMKQALVVDQDDIVSTLYGDSVFLAEGEDHKIAKQIFVLLGPAEDSKVVLTSGVKAGDEVITSGQMKLQDGSPIVVVPASAS